MNQDSFSSALADWRLRGMPANTTGWLYKVCRNKALNKIKKDKHLEGLTEKTETGSVEIRFNESVLGDQQLKLLSSVPILIFLQKTQVVITLKYIINLKKVNTL
jgi:predicted RNA polymerase sigma factor